VVQIRSSHGSRHVRCEHLRRPQGCSHRRSPACAGAASGCVARMS
jgi:hypothetical protein